MLEIRVEQVRGHRGTGDVRSCQTSRRVAHIGLPDLRLHEAMQALVVNQHLEERGEALKVVPVPRRLLIDATEPSLPVDQCDRKTAILRPSYELVDLHRPGIRDVEDASRWRIC